MTTTQCSEFLQRSPLNIPLCGLTDKVTIDSLIDTEPGELLSLFSKIIDKYPDTAMHIVSTVLNTRAHVVQDITQTEVNDLLLLLKEELDKRQNGEK